jgi:hypothetical protein
VNFQIEKMFQFRADDDDMETFGKSRAAEMIYISACIGNAIIRHLLANAKGRTNKSAKNVFNFFEITAKRFCLYYNRGGKKSAAKQPTISVCSRQTSTSCSSSSSSGFKCKFNISTKLVGENVSELF